jgi:prepilin-type processing-associated H-X9-DG protein
LLPALSKAKDRAIRTKCMSNVRQLDIGIIMYAGENRDNLPPASTMAGFWLWDIQTAVCSELVANGMSQGDLYCPGFPDQSALWNYTSGYRVIGYAMTFPGMDGLTVTSGVDWPATNINYKIIPQAINFGPTTFPPPAVTDRPLVSDATISAKGQDNPSLEYSSSYYYIGIVGGYGNQTPGQGFHRSPHLQGRFPSGGNVGMLDGHVQWRRFRDMLPRTDPNGGSVGTEPEYWW